jgi:hypothetical protein
MKQAFFFAAVAVAAAVLAALFTNHFGGSSAALEHSAAFKQWAEAHGKTYSSPEE